MAAATVAVLLGGCQSVVTPPRTTVPRTPAPPAVEAPAPAPETPPSASPQYQAATALTRNGQALLDAGRIDAAIREFERAVSLNPHNGPGYYYLSAAWMAKGNLTQAASFHRQAEIHLRGRTEWAERLRFQGAEIRRRSAGGAAVN